MADRLGHAARARTRRVRAATDRDDPNATKASPRAARAGLQAGARYRSAFATEVLLRQERRAGGRVAAATSPSRWDCIDRTADVSQPADRPSARGCRELRRSNAARRRRRHDAWPHPGSDSSATGDSKTTTRICSFDVLAAYECSTFASVAVSITAGASVKTHAQPVLQREPDLWSRQRRVVRQPAQPDPTRTLNSEAAEDACFIVGPWRIRPDAVTCLPAAALPNSRLSSRWDREAQAPDPRRAREHLFRCAVAGHISRHSARARASTRAGSGATFRRCLRPHSQRIRAQGLLPERRGRRGSGVPEASRHCERLVRGVRRWHRRRGHLRGARRRPLVVRPIHRGRSGGVRAAGAQVRPEPSCDHPARDGDRAERRGAVRCCAGAGGAGRGLDRHRRSRLLGVAGVTSVSDRA